MRSALRPRSASRLLVAGFAAAALSACASAPSPRASSAPEPLTPLQQYAIGVSQAPERIALAIHAEGLSPNQQTALADYFGRWRDNGGGALDVAIPAAAPSTPPSPAGGARELGLARRTAGLAIAYLEHLGAPADRLRLTSYAATAPGAPVVLSFQAVEAVAPDCRSGWSDLTATKDNKPQSHFGCAETANVAVMIANPRDLLTPAAEDPSDNNRREAVINGYRKGATTSTSVDPQAVGTVSTGQ